VAMMTAWRSNKQQKGNNETKNDHNRNGMKTITARRAMTETKTKH